MTIYESEQNSLFQIYSLRACAIHNAHWKDYQRAYFNKKKSEPKGDGRWYEQKQPKIGEKMNCRLTADHNFGPEVTWDV